MTSDGFQRASELLLSIKQALPFAEEIHKTVESHGRRLGPLQKQSLSWEDAVDIQTFKQFETLTQFLVDALFGRDVDNDSAVAIQLIDRARDQTRQNAFRVKHVDAEEESIVDIHRALQCARANARISQGLVRDLEQELEWSIERLFEAKDE